MDLQQLYEALNAVQQPQHTQADIYGMLDRAQNLQDQAGRRRAQPWAYGNSGMASAGAQLLRDHVAGEKEQGALDQLSEAYGGQSARDQYDAQMQAISEQIRQLEKYGREDQIAAQKQQNVMQGKQFDVDNRSPETTTLIKNLQAAGIDPRSPQGQKIIQQNLSKSQVSINTGLPKPQAGYVWNEGNTAQEPIPGTEQWHEEQQREQEFAQAEQAGAVARMTNREKYGGILDEIDNALELVSPSTTGVGGVITGLMPGSPSVDLEATLETIGSGLALDKLMAMKSDPANKTGGALGQVSERELALLMNSVTSIRQDISEGKSRAGLQKIRAHYSRFLDALDGKMPQGYNEQGQWVGNDDVGQQKDEAASSYEQWKKDNGL